MPNGFDRACPSGNIMIDGYREPRTVTCGRCSGSGTVEWDSMERFVDDLGHAIWEMKKTGHEPKTFRDLMKLARGIRKEGQECCLCDGTGEVDV